MAASGSKSFPPVGFLTVLGRPEVGWMGGYLILNAAGRPLEFHCTSPLRPNRAQEILYGPALRPFVFGEQIGNTLVTKSSLEPLFICTDVTEVLALRETITRPVVLIVDDEGKPSQEESRQWRRVDHPHALPGPHASPKLQSARRKLGKRDVVLPVGHEEEGAAISQSWAPFAENLDLLEPFARIREAIEETQRLAK